MTEEENAVLRQIAETTTRIVDQQERIALLAEENQPTDGAVEVLCALLDSISVQQERLEMLRNAAKDNPDN